jgi:hypothetical protein
MEARAERHLNAKRLGALQGVMSPWSPRRSQSNVATAVTNLPSPSTAERCRDVNWTLKIKISRDRLYDEDGEGGDAVYQNQ